jgi:hypothetical protein
MILLYCRLHTKSKFISKDISPLLLRHSYKPRKGCSPNPRIEVIFTPIGTYPPKKPLDVKLPTLVYHGGPPLSPSLRLGLRFLSLMYQST